MEKVCDLLVPASEAGVQLWIRGDGFVANASERVVDTADNLLCLFSEGEGNQSVGSTAMNKRSSRSRTVLMITVKLSFHPFLPPCLRSPCSYHPLLTLYH